MMDRKDKNSHTGRVPNTAAEFPRWIATAALFHSCNLLYKFLIASQLTPE